MIDIRKQLYREDRMLKNHLKLLDKCSLSNKNKKLILDFKNFCSALGNSTHRICTYIRYLKMFGEFLNVDFDKAKRTDIERAMSKLNEKNYSEWTKITFKKNVKRFYRWLYNLESTDSLPDCVKWIRCKTPPNTIKKEDLLTKEEVESMMRSTPNLMYKTIMSVLYEGALRPGELLQMRIKDVIFEQNYVTTYVRGKMEKSIGDRKIYLIQSYDLLMKWIENHPFKHDKSYPLWIVGTHQVHKNKDIYGKVFSREYLNKMLKNCAVNSGIQKRTYPYIFRHSRGTQLYIEMGESLAKKMMGHAPDSSMAKVYNHLNEEDVLHKLKELNGIEEIEKEDVNSPTCHRCGHPNSIGSDLCSRCGLSLNIKTAMIIEQENKEKDEQMKLMKQIMESLQKNPKALEIFNNPDFIEEESEKRAKEKFEKWLKLENNS